MRIASMRAGRCLVVAVALASLLALAPLTPAAPPTAQDDLRFLPADSQFVLMLRMDQLLASPGLVELPRQWSRLLPGEQRVAGRALLDRIEAEADDYVRTEIGTPLKNVERLLVGGNVKGEPIEVVRLKDPIKAADILAARKRPRSEKEKPVGYKEVRVGGYTFYEPDRDDVDAFCVIDEKGILLGKAKALCATLEDGEKRRPFSADMEAALKLADFAQTFVGAFDLRGVREKGNLPVSASPVDLNKVLEGGTAAAISIRAGDDFTVRAAVRCKDAAAARAVKERAYAATIEFARATAAPGNSPFDTNKEMRKLAAELVQKVRTTSEDETASISATLSAWSFLHLFPQP
jgi:hypothetical protein